MKTDVSFSDFCDAFVNMNRDNNFSHDGKRALYDYIIQYEEDCDKETELDVIAICCEYDEYEDLAEFWGNYDKEEYPDLETLRDHTTVIEIENSESFIILAF